MIERAGVVADEPRGIVTATVLVVLLGSIACGVALEPASMSRVADAEERWGEAPLLDYAITVDVDRPGERRRNEITVRGGRIVRASVSYWDPGTDRWSHPASLGEEQARPFTPLGLLDMVRRELTLKSRSDVLIALGGSPPFPRRIVLGALSRGDGVVPNSEATITVRHFDTER